MGFFDSIRHAFNPEIKETFDYLYRNYYKGLKSYCETSGINTHTNGYHIQITRINLSNPSYSDMKRIYDAKDTIIKIHKLIIEGEQIDADKKELKKLQSLYPHAFVFFCNECLGGVIYDRSIKMPGEKKNLYKSDVYEKSPFALNFGNKGCYYGNQFSPIPNNQRNASLYLNSKKTPYLTEPKSIEDLIYPDIKKLLTRRNQFASKEKEIIDKLESEDIQEKFEEVVLGNNRRSKYYKDFLTSKGCKENDFKYLVSHLNELDQFIICLINEKYDSIRRMYPLGVTKYLAITYYKESEIDKKERVINHQEEIKKLQEAKEIYNKLKAKYPKGLPAFEKYNSYNDGKNLVELSLSEIIEREDEIAKFEKNADEASFYEKWIHSQEEYAAECRKLVPKTFPGYGCYIYDIPFEIVKVNGEKGHGSYKVWNIFNSGYSEDEDVDLSYFPAYKRNKENLPKFYKKQCYFVQRVYDGLLDFIEKLKELYINDENIKILFAIDELLTKDVANYHFKYLMEQLNIRGIPYGFINPSPISVEDQVRYVIIDLISTVSRMKENCQTLINIKRNCRQYCTKKERYDCYSDIVYISLLKGFEKEELKKATERKIKEAEKKEAEKIKREEEERKRIEVEKRKAEEAERLRKFEEETKRLEEIKRQQDISNLKSCVSSWPQPSRSTLHCFSLYYYYPTNCGWDVDQRDWDIRNLIWNFKANPNKPQSSFEISVRHEQAMDEVIPLIKRVIQRYFGDKTSKLTLVCIPSSKRIVTERRYKDFSAKLCSLTGMSNGYDYVNVSSEGEAKHLGGSAQAEYTVDNYYFKNRFVILFDDVITSGRSMENFKYLLDQAGATVIAGLSIGKTKHEPQISHPIDNI